MDEMVGFQSIVLKFVMDHCQEVFGFRIVRSENIYKIWIMVQLHYTEEETLPIEYSHNHLNQCDTVISFNYSFYLRPVLAFGYCHRLRLCVCLCVCQSLCQSLACPRYNSGPVQARISKFGPKV